MIHYLSNVFPPDRIQSLEFRFNNEELLVDHARERIIFGWGGWGRSLVQLNPPWGPMTIQDSLWVIAFGQHGRVGLISLITSILLPPLSLFVMRFSPAKWSKKETAPVAVLSLMVILYLLDSLMNALINPIYIVVCGGISSIVLNGFSFRKNPMKTKPASEGNNYVLSAPSLMKRLN